jgi:hypothetical protein
LKVQQLAGACYREIVPGQLAASSPGDSRIVYTGIAKKQLT